jgi:NAD+ kinase
MAIPSKPVRTVGLFGKYGSRDIGGVVERLCSFVRDRGLGVLLEAATAEFMEHTCADSAPLDEIGKRIDLAIVVGGDGTLLHTARMLAPHGVPLIGVNLGRLGFLTDISTERMEDDLGRILDGDFKTEPRILLEAEVVRDGQVQHRANAMNDVVINKGTLARLIEFETRVDGEFVSSTRADGIIVATPTGSTAYALSAGGPILHPTLPALVLVPICPHTLSDRPLAVGSDSLIEITMISTSRQSAHVTFDGQTNFALHDKDLLRVRRSERPAILVHPSRRSHYEVLRAKLGWGEKL